MHVVLIIVSRFDVVARMSELLWDLNLITRSYQHHSFSKNDPEFSRELCIFREELYCISENRTVVEGLCLKVDLKSTFIKINIVVIEL